MKSQKILIVGGGIAGLTSTIALTQRGHSVDVIERTPEWKPIGAGIMLQANAIAILSTLGLKEEIETRGFYMSSMQVTDSNGRILSALDFQALETELGPSYALHRADLHSALLNHCAHVAIHMNETIATVAQTKNSVAVTFSSGQTATYDFVVGADGINSQVRNIALAQNTPPLVYSGYSCWRFVGENIDNLSAPVEMWGRGKRVGVVPLTNGRCYIYMTKNAPVGEADPTKNRQQAVAAQFAEFQGPARSALGQLDESKVLMRHDLMELREPVWGNGRILLVGDAAHAMTPNMGQGAAQAIEGALALTLAIDKADNAAQILPAYQQLHSKRVKKIQTRSRQVGRIAQWSNHIACQTRNWLTRIAPQTANQSNLINTITPGVLLAQQYNQ